MSHDLGQRRRLRPEAIRGALRLLTQDQTAPKSGICRILRDLVTVLSNMVLQRSIALPRFARAAARR